MTREWLRPIAGPDEAEELRSAAQADGHEVLFPRYVVTRETPGGAEIIGAVGSWVVHQAWAHTKKINARQSVRLLQELEGRLRNGGATMLCLPCTQNSPFRPFMERLGFVYGWEAGLFFKRLQCE